MMLSISISMIHYVSPEDTRSSQNSLNHLCQKQMSLEGASRYWDYANEPRF